MLVAACYLARCAQTWQQANDRFQNPLGHGYSPVRLRHSMQGARAAFDALLALPRRGGQPTSRFLQVRSEWKDRSDAELEAHVLSLLPAQPSAPRGDPEARGQRSECGLRVIASATPERNPRLRARTIELHALDCAACGFNSVGPEIALKRANAKFRARMGTMERDLAAGGPSRTVIPANWKRCGSGPSRPEESRDPAAAVARGALSSHFRRSGSETSFGAWIFAQRTPVAAFQVVNACSRTSRRWIVLRRWPAARRLRQDRSTSRRSLRRPLTLQDVANSCASRCLGEMRQSPALGVVERPGDPL